MTLNVSYGERYGWMVVQVTGEMDLGGVAALRERLQRLIAEGCQRMVVDISRLGFCDSTGFGVLVATRRLIAARGGRLRLVLPGPDVHIRQVLSLFGIEKIFEVYDSAEEALGDQRATPDGPGAGVALPQQRDATSATAD
ncbi:anti-sigma B factor antagonist [Kitasatospora sp. MAP12-15]|uniref:STAS domain-containing protein n=1 Tax=unclassified Kitasatospora TaxID=2633591 RepID=UPI0024732416|nr:STAS domain-containing protein [Kitasatospora sp. MAP12-44]MDH6108305.1 anti-sigma B factor antagonist [Kitasatospora sp. MAP12-44]